MSDQTTDVVLTDAERGVLGDLTHRPDYHALVAAVERIAAARVAAARADERERLAYRPYRDDAPLVAIHEAEWDDAQEALSQVPHLEDALAGQTAYIEALPSRVADYLLTHIGGDEAQAWQAGHNYAMREAARLVRERWWATSGDAALAEPGKPPALGESEVRP